VRVAFVVPRYGAEVGGGAEAHVRRIATLLARDVACTVLTSCALDYRTWADHYPPGESRDADVRVLRFRVAQPRDVARFDRISAQAFARPDDLALGRRWMREQGPDVPGIREHLLGAHERYDVVCFAPYLYATTADSIEAVAERAVLLTLAHDEPPLRLAVFDAVWRAPRVIVYNTPEELELLEARFGRDARPRFGIGLWVDDPPPSEPERFRVRYGIEGRYLLVLGRVEPAKGAALAIDRYRELRTRRDDVSLVLVGRRHMELPELEGLVATGFVDDQTKHDAIAGADVVLVPSPYESLSLSALEAWSHGRPTLANGASTVLVGQSRRSGGGLWFADEAEFHATLALLLDTPPLAETLGLQGRRFVRGLRGAQAVRAAWLEALGSAARAVLAD
jgi:glycosyltransferase involved in cell wall biosynthesis